MSELFKHFSVYIECMFFVQIERFPVNSKMGVLEVETVFEGDIVYKCPWGSLN